MMEKTIFNPLLKKIVSKIIKRCIRKRYGCNCNVTFDKLDISSDESTTTISINGKFTILNKDFDTLLKDLV